MYCFTKESVISEHGVRCRGGRGGGRPPRFWRKVFQYIPPPPDFGGFCSEMF